MKKRTRVSTYHDQIVKLAPIKTVTELAEHLNIATSSLTGYLKRNGIDCKSERTDVSLYMEEVEKLAYEGYTVKQIAEVLNLNASSLNYQVKTRGINVRNGKYLQENLEEESKVLDLHDQGFTYSEISEKLGIPYKRIPMYLKKNNVKTRTFSESFRCGFSLDERAFDDFNKEEPVYWFGWLLTDGCLSDKNLISISLKSEDSEIVEGLKKFLKSDSKVNYLEYFHKQSGKVVQTTSFAVMSKKLADALKSQNLYPRKSCTERLPNFDWLDGEHAAVFWRACIEGDGYVSNIETDSRKYARISLVGSKELLGGFSQYVHKHCGIPLKEVSTNKKNVDPRYATIEYSGKSAYFIIKKLWSAGSIFLTRKKNRADNIISFYEPSLDIK